MHLQVVDRLVCPRCGPPFGLVLLAERVEAQRVLAGALGCPNCRDRFPVSGGFGDLRAPPRDPLPEGGEAPAPEPEETLRLAALLGITEGPGQVALVGGLAAHAAPLAALVPGLEVVAVGAALGGAAERPGVSRMAAGPGLPFQPGALRGLALGTGEDALIPEAARVLGMGARLVVMGASGATAEAAAAAGLQPMLRQDGVLVAGHPGPRGPSGGIRLPVVR